MNKVLDVYLRLEVPHKMCRGFRGVAIIINPIMAYTALSRIVHDVYQSPTISMMGIILTVMYIFPRAKPADKKYGLTKSQRSAEAKQ